MIDKYFFNPHTDSILQTEVGMTKVVNGTRIVDTVEIAPDPMDKMQLFGATGRIGDLITPKGYDHLLNILQRQDASSKEAVQLLHRWTGWALEFIENGYQRIDLADRKYDSKEGKG